ncbi:MAG: redoxin domain-containing protein [Acidobacteria bacterium]|nr:redoxin domain-containing protein [Acidobacteriota bacterium]
MEQNKEGLKKQGLGLAAVSYDSPAILKNFADRRAIHYPLLSDPDSAVIRAFGILNESVPKSSPFFGIPHPVTFLISRDGKVSAKYFEEDYKERQTLAGLLAKDYGIEAGAARATPKAKHVRITTAASTATVAGGQRILLSVSVEMDKEIHVYAPGVEGYHAVEWKMVESPVGKAHEVVFPKAKILFLPAIQEKVPVYEGKLMLLRDITLAQEKALRPMVDAKGTLRIQGTLKYQACSDRLCYPPETVPLEWTVQLTKLDSERAPAELRKKSGL